MITTRVKMQAPRVKISPIKTAMGNVTTADPQEIAKEPVAFRARKMVKDAEKARVKAIAAERATNSGMVVLARVTYQLPKPRSN